MDATTLSNAIWDILVREAGALELDRDLFLQWFAEKNGREYRIGGALGFGGKFWRTDGRFHVNCYPEDLTPESQQVIDRTNQALDSLTPPRQSRGR